MKQFQKLLIAFLLFSQITFAQRADEVFTGYATAQVDPSGRISVYAEGFLNKETEEIYTTKTIQNIGSVSKTFIGVSLMIAKEKGLIDLDKNIYEYLDFEVKNPLADTGNFITLRQLATHTSGIIDNEKYYLKAYSEGKEPDMALGEYLKEYFTKEGKYYSEENFINSNGGKRFEYSNIGAALAAYVIERASGMSFSKFTKQYILIPLKMEYSGWNYDEIDTSKHAILYNENDVALKPYTLITYPDGGFRTSVEDLSLYLKELIKGYNHNSSMLKNESWDELFRKNFTEENSIENINPKEPNTGLFMMYSKSGKIGHTGSDPGACCIMWFDPENGTGTIFMANEDLTKDNVASFKEIWASLNE